jgi:hypothetical protein
MKNMVNDLVDYTQKFTQISKLKSSKANVKAKKAGTNQRATPSLKTPNIRSSEKRKEEKETTSS